MYLELFDLLKRALNLKFLTPSHHNSLLLACAGCAPLKPNLLQVTDAREEELRRELDGLQERHVELKRKFKSIVGAYRTMRHAVEDRWVGSAMPGTDPPHIPHDSAVLGMAMEQARAAARYPFFSPSLHYAQPFC